MFVQIKKQAKRYPKYLITQLCTYHCIYITGYWREGEWERVRQGRASGRGVKSGASGGPDEDMEE